MVIFPQWGALSVGDTISFVGKTIVLDNGGKHLFRAMENPAIRVVVEGELPKMADVFTFLDVRVKSVEGLVCCQLIDASHALPIAPCLGEDLRLVVELCSGMGAFSSVVPKLGGHVVAGVEQNECWRAMFQALHSGDTSFIVGDIAGTQAIKQLHHQGATHATIMSGISCQPYSTAGDKKGLLDPRSQSLPKTLQTMWFLQSPICILECVEGIQHHQEAIALIQDFCNQVGFCFTQTVLHLDHIWCTKRTRWFAVLSSSVIGPINIPDFVTSVQYRKVKDVMPSIHQWPQSEIEQLELSLYELTKFDQFAKGGIEACFLDSAGVLPTILHSAGGQLYPCRCGCRQALSLSRLEQRGLFCTLVPNGNTVFHELVHRKCCRYLRPIEAFFLNGGSPLVEFPTDMRLGLSAVGQCVSPVQATWVMGHVMKAVGQFLGSEIVDPVEALNQHIGTIIKESHTIWAPDVNILTEDETVNQLDFELQLQPDCPPVHFRASECATVADFVSAQTALDPGSRLDFLKEHESCRIVDFSWPTFPHDKVQPAMIDELMPCPCEEWTPMQDVVESEDSAIENGNRNTDSQTAICQLDSSGLLELGAPLVMLLGGVASLKNPNMTKQQRITILSHQGGVWADDEISFQLEVIAKDAPPEQKLFVWDPLVLSSVVRSGCLRPLHEYAKDLAVGSTVATRVLIEKHWYPLVLRWGHNGIFAFSCGLAFQFSLALQIIVREVCKIHKMEPPAVKSTPIKFLVERQCGALAINFIRQLIFGKALVTSLAELDQEHLGCRETFVASLHDFLPRPWIWGNGESWSDKLHSLLQDHGVPLAEVAERARQVVDRLGENAVATAMKGPQPWRELKAISNQAIPMVQLIKPSELQALIEKRAGSGQAVGSKHHKLQSKGKGKGKVSHSLDPSVLRVESGVFVCGDQVPLGQIAISQVGPSASGIVLTSVIEAMPYLKGGKQISSGGLAFLIVDGGDGVIPTTLIAEKIRFDYSGIGGLFLEPKAVDGKSPSQDFHVIWLAKMTLAEVQVCKRTVGGIIGLARMGEKLGLRCLTQDAERIHQALKPTSSFLPAGKKLHFLLGPVPFGSLKQSICDAVASVGWKARPIQPVPTTGLIDGVLWKLQSVEPPPQNIIVGQHGEMVITRMADEQVQVKQFPSIVGANRTVQMCATGKVHGEPDPLQSQDPWGAYMKNRAGSMPKISAQDPVKILEEKVVESVMKRLPRENMEVDSCMSGSGDDRITTLEAKVAALHDNQSQLHQMVMKQGETHGQYIDKLANQQHRLEQAVGEQSNQLCHFQGQFKAQLEQQQGQLDSLFQQQMMKLEDLLAKKQRTE